MGTTSEPRIILDLCGGTGSWSRPYREAGYDVRVVTLPMDDVRTYLPPQNVHGILAAPPCTEFSIVKDHKLPRDLDGALDIVRACQRIIDHCAPAFWAIENPVGYLRDSLGAPVYSFQPWWFGDGWCKRTFLWGTFTAPKRTHERWEDVPQIPGLYVRPGRKRPSIAFNHKSHAQYIEAFKGMRLETDAAFRAVTPPGFAQAFFQANP